MTLKTYIACPYCDAIYKNKPIQTNEKLICRDCHCVIDSGKTGFHLPFIYALTALILFVISNTLPFITINLKGEESTITVFSSIKALFDNHLPMLGVIVFMLIIIMPLWYLVAMLWVAISFKLKLFHRITHGFLHWMDHLAPWNMLDVYLVGVLVTMVKILTLAEIRFEPAFWTFLLLMICNGFANHYFHLHDAMFYAHEKNE